MVNMFFCYVIMMEVLYNDNEAKSVFDLINTRTPWYFSFKLGYDILYV